MRSDLVYASTFQGLVGLVDHDGPTLDTEYWRALYEHLCITTNTQTPYLLGCSQLNQSDLVVSAKDEAFKYLMFRLVNGYEARQDSGQDGTSPMMFLVSKMRTFLTRTNGCTASVVEAIDSWMAHHRTRNPSFAPVPAQLFIKVVTFIAESLQSEEPYHKYVRPVSLVVSAVEARGLF